MSEIDKPVHESDRDTGDSALTLGADPAPLLAREGLPPDAVILIPAHTAAPMTTPHGCRALRILAADLTTHTDAHTADGIVTALSDTALSETSVGLLAAAWITDLTDPDPGTDAGDVAVRLLPPSGSQGQTGALVDIELLLAHSNRWRTVGRWPRLDDRWPEIIGATAAMVMDLLDNDFPSTVPAAGHDVAEVWTPPAATGALRADAIRVLDLVRAGHLHPGEELIWDRRNVGVRHTLRVTAGGGLRLADGRVCATPTAATTLLAGKHQNGWLALRTADGRNLDQLRRQLTHC